MDLDPIVPQPGSDRDPAHFVGRVATTTRARERLTAGANLLLTDPRRMGKTFWMRTFAAREKGFRCYILDYEGVSTVENFLIRTGEELVKNEALPEKGIRSLKKIFGNVDIELSGPITIKTYHRPTSPHRLLADALKTLDEDTSGIVPLVMMDEVPLAIYNEPFSPEPMAQGPGSARWCGKDGCGVGVVRTGAAHLALPRTFPRHHADPGQPRGLPGEKGSISPGARAPERPRNSSRPFRSFARRLQRYAGSSPAP